MDNITTIIFQNTADRMFTGVIDLTALNYKKNVGHLMLALFSALGFVCADDGKTLSHSSNPTAKLIWCKPASKGSRKAEDVARPTLLGQLQGLDLTHDGTPGAGSRAAQAAAAAARPPAAPRALPLALPVAADRIGRLGTGYGNMPRAISECCVAEQSSLDDLVVRVQHAVRTCASCAASLRRVHSPREPHWSCHSVGLVTVCRFECDNGCAINWASAKPLRGPPAKPASVAAAAHPANDAPTAPPPAAPFAAAPTAAAAPADAPAPAAANAANTAPPAASPLDAATVRKALERALTHTKRVKPIFSMTVPTPKLNLAQIQAPTLTQTLTLTLTLTLTTNPNPNTGGCHRDGRTTRRAAALYQGGDREAAARHARGDGDVGTRARRAAPADARAGAEAL